MPPSSPHPSPARQAALRAGARSVPSQRAEQQSLSPVHAPPAVVHSAPPHTPPLQPSEQQSAGLSQRVPSAWQYCAQASAPVRPVGSHRPLQQLLRVLHGDARRRAGARRQAVARGRTGPSSSRSSRGTSSRSGGTARRSRAAAWARRVARAVRASPSSGAESIRGRSGVGRRRRAARERRRSRRRGPRCGSRRPRRIRAAMTATAAAMTQTEPLVASVVMAIDLHRQAKSAEHDDAPGSSRSGAPSSAYRWNRSSADPSTDRPQARPACPGRRPPTPLTSSGRIEA